MNREHGSKEHQAPRVPDGVQPQHARAYAAWLELVGHDGADDGDGFNNTYLGEFESPADFARHLWEDLGLAGAIEGTLPKSLRGKIEPDYEAWARGLQLGGKIAIVATTGGSILVFRIAEKATRTEATPAAKQATDQGRQPTIRPG